MMTTTPARVARTSPAATRSGTRSGLQEQHASILFPRGHQGLHTRELSKLADDLWCGLNERHSGAKSHHVTAAVPDDGEELAEAVAALNVQPKRPQHKKTAAKGGKSQGKLCHVHKKYRDQTWKCGDPRNCTWSRNE